VAPGSVAGDPSVVRLRGAARADFFDFVVPFVDRLTSIFPTPWQMVGISGLASDLGS